MTRKARRKAVPVSSFSEMFTATAFCSLPARSWKKRMWIRPDDTRATLQRRARGESDGLTDVDERILGGVSGATARHEIEPRTMISVTRRDANFGTWTHWASAWQMLMCLGPHTSRR